MRLLLKNGKIYQTRNNFTHALYIENGVIVSTGQEAMKTEQDLSPHEVEDLHGKTVVPGFNDAHLHFYQSGLSLSTVNLYDSSSVEEVIRRGTDYLSMQPESSKPIVGRGFNQDHFTEKRLPDKRDLDKVTTDRPVIFTRTCSHLAVINSKALDMLDLSNPLPEVSGGQIDIGPDGKPNGIFRENAIRLLDSLLEKVTVESILSHIRAAADNALKEGLTSLQVNDIWLNTDDAQMMEEAYRRYTREDGSLRIYHQVHVEKTETLRSRIESGWDKSESPYLRYGLLKMYADGSLGARTAFMRKPYADDPSTTGIPTMTEESLLEFIGIAEDNDIQTAIHVIGDGALERVLNCYEKLIKKGNPNRHGLIHVQITDRPLLERIKKLNLMVYAQPIFLHNDMHIVEDRVGRDLAETSYAFGSMEKMGIKVAYSTDAPIEKFHVMENLHCAVNRQDLKNYPENGYYSDERVDRFTAMDNITINAAYMSFEEDRKGRILPGCYADLVILNEPYFDVDPSAIKDIKVEKTMISGRYRYIRR
ncbi:MAG TPA: amidohydrolase [Clostridiaceae bacterium]|nr:amidohydrolase [Clostridiaceae bacterium]